MPRNPPVDITAYSTWPPTLSIIRVINRTDILAIAVVDGGAFYLVRRDQAIGLVGLAGAGHVSNLPRTSPRHRRQAFGPFSGQRPGRIYMVIIFDDGCSKTPDQRRCFDSARVISVPVVCVNFGFDLNT